MGKKKYPKIKIKERKLGKELAAGQSFMAPRKLIELDPRQSNREYLDTLIHELLHIITPDWDEMKVRRNSRIMTKYLWEQGYRRVYK